MSTEADTVAVELIICRKHGLKLLACWTAGWGGTSETRSVSCAAVLESSEQLCQSGAWGDGSGGQPCAISSAAVEELDVNHLMERTVLGTTQHLVWNLVFCQHGQE